MRIVLVRRFDPQGLVFFTNYGSRKAAELSSNPVAALCFYWYWIDQQVRIEETIEQTTAEESDEYFASRPRGSQVGAWASLQSRPLAARAELEQRYRVLEGQYESETIPRPSFWGGYRLMPMRFEFWKAGAYRLHDRQLFTRKDQAWSVETLYP